MKTMITVATTGAWPTKKDNPHIPITPAEIAEDVYQCWEAGAAIAHIHVRDESQRGSMSRELFEETAARVREKCDIVLNLTTSGALDATDETRQAHLRTIRPEMASFDCGTMNWMHTTIFENHPKFLEQLGRTMLECDIKPEIEVFDTSFIYNAMHYVKKGILKAPAHYQFVLGAPGGIAATVENLVYLKNLLPEGSTWSAFGIGKGHMPVLYTTIAMGGHIRVGMEDNVYYAKDRLAVSNREFVERAVRIIHEFGGSPATPDDARQILGLRFGR